MRLIDADALIEKSKLHGMKFAALQIVIHNAPTIEAEPVVRCKECKWYDNLHLCRQLSRFGSIEPLADFYCAFGERREISND